MIVKTAIGFLTEDSDAKLIERVQGAITGLTGNANFPTPAPSLTTMSAALSAFATALADAVNGGKELNALKNAKRAELVSLMRQLASYVTVTADGDMTKLLSSGFPYQKPTRSRVGILAPPTAPSLRRGKKAGSLDASTMPVYGASSYNWRVALASTPNVDVRTVQSTGSRLTFEDLTPGQTYNVEVNAVGAEGVSDWSDASALMVV